MKYRKNLSGKEELVTKFLKKQNVYKTLFGKVNFVSEAWIQKLGVDFYTPKKYVFVDEKAAVNYAGTGIRNVVGDYINLFNKHIGWMADKKALTTHLMQEFIILKDNDKRYNYTDSDIFAIDIMFIDFSKLRHYLDSIGWDIDAALALLKTMDENNICEVINEEDKNVQLRITKDLKEKPGFIRIKRNTLINNIGAECISVTHKGLIREGFVPRNEIPSKGKLDNWR